MVGFIIMLLTWIVNFALGKFGWSIPAKYLPWVSVGLGVASQVAFALAAGVGWIDAVLAGVAVGFGGSGAYSAFGKHIGLAANKE